MGSSNNNKKWHGIGSISIIPPKDYWEDLIELFPSKEKHIEVFQDLSNRRLNEFDISSLPPPKKSTNELLEHIANDGWLEREQRYSCPKCNYMLSQQEIVQPICPECDEAFSRFGDINETIVYIRKLSPSRNVDWVVAIHGMNTSGPWQEAFSWLISTTWGRSVPVAIYKYGNIKVGVLRPLLRRKLKDKFRKQLIALRDQAFKQGFLGNPDLIAHSFGTWLIGHLLEDEVNRSPDERICFGRIILTGCILRPDFNWNKIKEMGLVEDVLNHYGGSDNVVPFAHATIWDSGPSGRQGFNSGEVLNVCSEGFGHSDFFSIKKKKKEVRFLEYSYRCYWRPFLTLPKQEISTIKDQKDPEVPWKPLPWPLCGALFPFLVIPFVLALLVLLTSLICNLLLCISWFAIIIACICALGLGIMLVTIFLIRILLHK